MEQEAVRAACADRKVVLIVGDAGIGKTTLARAALGGIPHAAGVAVEGLRWRPYLPLSAAIGEDLSGDADDVASRVAESLAGRVLFVDDLHAADASSRDAIAVLARKVPLVVTSRPPIPQANWPGNTVTIALRPLSPAACRQLARTWHRDLDATQCEQLVGMAGGNPLLLRFLAAGNRVTPTLRAAAASRLDRFALPVRAAVNELALFARPLAVTHLAVPVAALPDELVSVDGDTVKIRHALLAEAAVAAMGDDERAAARVALAGRLPAAAAAEQYLEAGANGAAERAARDALREASDGAERAHLLEIVADATGDDLARLDAAAALVAAGAWAAAARQASAVTGQEKQHRLAAAYHLSRSRWFTGDVAGAAQAVDHGIAMAGADASDPMAARLLVERAAQRVRVVGGSGTATPYAQEALASAVAAGVDVTRAKLTLATALAHDNAVGWEELFHDVLAEAASAGDAESECGAGYFLGSRLSMVGRFDDALRVLDRGLAVAARAGLGTWRLHLEAAALTVRFQLGRDHAAVLAESRDFLERHPLFRNGAQLDLVVVLSLADEGRIDEARDHLAAAKSERQAPEDMSLLATAEAELAWIAGDLEWTLDAATRADAFGAGFFGATTGARAAACYARFELGEPCVVALAPVQAPAFGTFNLDIAAHNKVAMGDVAGARIAFDAASAAWSARPAPRWALRAEWAAALVAVRLGDRSARRRLARTQIAAGALGLSWLVQRCALALARLDIGRPVLTPAEARVLELIAEGLTSRQIAARLGVSKATIETHVRAVMRKTGASTRASAVAVARSWDGPR